MAVKDPRRVTPADDLSSFPPALPTDHATLCRKKGRAAALRQWRATETAERAQ